MADTIHRAPGNATGLSRRAGEPIRDPAGLPDHRVEIHVFRNGDAASAFVDGLALAGNPNSLAWDHETGTEADNRTVLVARLDEPRPRGATLADCLPVIHHAATRHDEDAREESLRRIHAERAAAYAAGRACTSGLREALEAAGHVCEDPGNGWVRAALATFELGAEGISGEFMDYDDHGDPEPIRARALAAAAAAGFRRAGPGPEYEGGPYADPAAAVAAIAAFAGLRAGIAAIRAEEYHRAFMARMKVTGPRRRFLAAAAEHGILISRNRNNLQASAGGVRVKATEFGELVRAGWIREDGGRRAAVTPEGLAAAGLERADVSPAP